MEERRKESKESMETTAAQTQSPRDDDVSVKKRWGSYVRKDSIKESALSNAIAAGIQSGITKGYQKYLERRERERMEAGETQSPTDDDDSVPKPLSPATVLAITLLIPPVGLLMIADLPKREPQPPRTEPPSTAPPSSAGEDT